MLEVKGKVVGQDLDFAGYHDNGLEADAISSDVAVRSRLRTLASGAYCPQILDREAIFVAIDHDPVGVSLN